MSPLVVLEWVGVGAFTFFIAVFFIQVLVELFKKEGA